jgi:hypothetical protein
MIMLRLDRLARMARADNWLHRPRRRFLIRWRRAVRRLVR